MYIYIYMRTYIYTYIYIHTHMYVYTHLSCLFDGCLLVHVDEVCDERWGAGVEYHFQEFNEPYAPS